MNLEILPVGTIVILKKELRKVMIFGYDQKLISNPADTFRYVGCFYPEGYISADKNILFQASDIKRVYFLGMQDSSYDQFIISKNQGGEK